MEGDRSTPPGGIYTLLRVTEGGPLTDREHRMKSTCKRV